MGFNGTLLHDDRHRGERAGAPVGERREPSSEAMARAEAACRANGARLTPIRRRVLETLQATRGSLGAYEIADALADEEGRRLAPITIYRALEFLIAQGLAHRLASRNAFIACAHGHRREELVAFLICETCGEVEERTASGLTGAVSQLLGSARFDPHLKLLEIAGRCARCSTRPA
jgi:Fur family zinc uptake transcriptional regulator